MIQQALSAIAEEMFVILKRASMSPIIYEVLDVGTGITDPDGEMVSSGAGIPGFIGVLDKSVRHLLTRHRQARRSGPATSSSPTIPIMAASPTSTTRCWRCRCFVDGELVAWTANIGHWSDVGGSTPGSMAVDARDIFAEGLRLPASS